MGCQITKSLKSVLPSVKECRLNNDRECPLEKEEKILKKARAYFIKEGVHRRGYRFTGSRGTKCVIKLPAKEFTIGANITEIESWKKFPEKARKHFVEVSDFDKNGDWITQPKVITLRQLGIKYSIISDFQNEIEDDGIHCSDIHSQNVGVYDKNKRKKINTSMIKILDYGFGVCYLGKKLSSKDTIDTKRKDRGRRKSSSSSERTISPELFNVLK